MHFSQWFVFKHQTLQVVNGKSALRVKSFNICLKWFKVSLNPLPDEINQIFALELRESALRHFTKILSLFITYSVSTVDVSYSGKWSLCAFFVILFWFRSVFLAI